MQARMIVGSVLIVLGAAWLAVRSRRIERERACDDHVLNAGLKSSSYGNHLLEVARSARVSRRAALAAVAMARPGQLEGRLPAVLDPKRSHRTLTRFTMGVAVAAVACLLLPLAAVKLADAVTEGPTTASGGTRGATDAVLTEEVSARVRAMEEQVAAVERAERQRRDVAEAAAWEKEQRKATGNVLPETALSAARVIETELWPAVGDSSYVVLAPDGKRMVLVVREGPEHDQYVLRDGKRVGEIYDVLHWVTFSPDSRSLAFAAKSRDKWFMIQDGLAVGGAHDGVGRPVFSPDGRSLAYAVKDGQEHFVLRDGEGAGPSGPFWVGDPVFSPDGRSLVYTMLMKSLRECYVVRDGVAVPAPGDRVVSQPIFSPDSRSLAFVVESHLSMASNTWKATWFLAKDGERVGEAYTFGGSLENFPMCLNDPVFSPDGTSLAWVAPAPGGKEFVAIDGVRASRDYDRVAGVAFGPDGRSLALLAHEGGRSIVIRDGVQVGTQYGNVILPILYSPDGRSIAFKAEQGRRAFIVRDGMQVTPDYEQISNIVMSVDGKSFLFAAIRNRVAYRVEVPWAEAQPASSR